MKNKFRYFFCLSVLALIPVLLIGQPDKKDSSVSQKLQDQQELTGKVKRPQEDFPEIAKEKVTETEARISGTVRKKAIPVWLWIIIGFVPGLIAGGLLVFRYSRLKIYSILATEKNKYLDRLKLDTAQDPLQRKLFKYVGMIGLLKRSKDEKKRTVANLTKDISLLKKQNDTLKVENEQKEKIISDLRADADNQVAFTEHYDRQRSNSPGKPENNQDIYFTIPEGDGSFRTSNATAWQEIDCFYKIVPDENDQKGKLYFISGDYDLRALDNIDYYLNPVCEIQNITDRSFARKIIMTDPGIVIKRGDYWRIEDNCKVKIKLV